MSETAFLTAFGEWIDCSISSLDDLEKRVDEELNTQEKFDEYMDYLNQ